jgi:hypothetical protein
MENSRSWDCWDLQVYIHENLISLALVLFVGENEAIPWNELVSVYMVYKT